MGSFLVDIMKKTTTKKNMLNKHANFILHTMNTVMEVVSVGEFALT